MAAVARRKHILGDSPRPADRDPLRSPPDRKSRLVKSIPWGRRSARRSRSRCRAAASQPAEVSPIFAAIVLTVSKADKPSTIVHLKNDTDSLLFRRVRHAHRDNSRPEHLDPPLLDRTAPDQVEGGGLAAPEGRSITHQLTRRDLDPIVTRPGSAPRLPVIVGSTPQSRTAGSDAVAARPRASRPFCDHCTHSKHLRSPLIFPV